MRLLLLIVLLLIPAAAPSTRAAAPPPTPAPVKSGLLKVHSACSLSKVAAELSRRTGQRVEVSPGLAGIRVVWAFREGVSFATTLNRLAELVGGRAVEVKSAGGKSGFRLTEGRETPRWEAWWRTEGLVRASNAALAAAEQIGRGEKATGLTSGLAMGLLGGFDPEFGFLRFAGPRGIERLLAGETVPIPRDAIPAATQERYFHRVYELMKDRDEPAAARIRDQRIETIRRDGLQLQYDPLWGAGGVSIILWYGSPGGFVSVNHSFWTFGDDELGLPATRRSPYDLLAARVSHPTLSPAHVSLQRPLPSGVKNGPGRHAEDLFLELAQIAGLDLVADAYLCRVASRERYLARGSLERGKTVAEALDALASSYQYLWWEKDGCVYLRSRAWMWNRDYETPDGFVDSWQTSLARGGAAGAREVAQIGALTREHRNGLWGLPGRGGTGALGVDQSVAKREAIAFFHRLTPGQQDRLMGAGLTVTPASLDAFPEVARFVRMHAGREAETAKLLLKQVVTQDAAQRPPLSVVRFRFACEPSSSQWPLEFAVAIPWLPDPFTGVPAVPPKPN